MPTLSKKYLFVHPKLFQLYIFYLLRIAISRYDIVIMYILDKGGQYCNNFMYMVNLERNNIIILIMFNVRRNV